MDPLLSVVTVTYNHEPFITKCIEGVLMQKVDFPMEFIIAEDCSTDGTRAICEKYAARYPEQIHFITSDFNVGCNPNELRAMRAVRGKYIAYCEGDDYWTDPLKLQKQVDFLETHPDYSICFHRCRHWIVKTDSYMADQCANLFTAGYDGIDLSLDMFFGKWITQPLTMVFKTDCLDLTLYDKYRYYRDMHQIYHILKAGKGYIFAFDGGIRTIHDGGIASTLSVVQQCENAVAIAEELYVANRDYSTKKYYADVLQWYLYHIKEIKSGRFKKSFALFSLDGDIKVLLKNLFR